jgi:hypothetical protein
MSRFWIGRLAAVCLLIPCFGVVAGADGFFIAGSEAYRKADYATAAREFSNSARHQLASGTLQNLGNAEWQRGRSGAAVLAWEQSVWLDPFNRAARDNLRFARKAAQLESPDLAWYEAVSAWLPPSWWAWMAGIGLWVAVGLTTLPEIFRWRRTGWQQAIAAFGIMVFLLSVPAHLGVFTRSRLGFFLEKETELRLTPTADGQVVARFGAGEPARCERTRGNYLLVRTNRGLGWVDREKFAQICSANWK